MWKTFYLTLLLGISYTAPAQVVAVQNISDTRSLYLCMTNTIKVAVENQSSDNTVLTTDNGVIVKDEYGGKGVFKISPQHYGRVMIYVKRKTRQGLKVIDSVAFWTKRFPLSRPRLAGMTGGAMTKKVLCCQIAPRAAIECCGFDAQFMIKSFTVVVTRCNREIFYRVNSEDNGTRIDSVTRVFFQKLRNRDKVLFKDITIKDCDGASRIMESMEFTITEADKYHKPPKRLKHGYEVIIDPVTGNEYIKKW